MDHEIKIYCETQEDKKLLPSHVAKCGIDFLTPSKRQDFDFLSPDIIIVAANVTITLLNVLLTYIQKKRERRILLKGISGWQIEIPADCTEEQLQEYLKIATEKQADKIIVSSK